MPGERGPRNVPMIPLADMVAFNGSVSNHSSRKSDALIVMSLKRAWNRSSPRLRKCLPSLRSPRRSFGLKDVGSGGTIAMIGLTANAKWYISLP